MMKSDLSDFYYNLRIPHWMARWFALPSVPGWLVGKPEQEVSQSCLAQVSSSICTPEAVERMHTACCPSGWPCGDVSFRPISQAACLSPDLSVAGSGLCLSP